MNVELRHLRYFVAVAHKLSFTEAAQELHMTQPPLSSSIRALEDELGVKLFFRSTRRVDLTPAGRALLAHAERILKDVDEAISEVQTRGGIIQLSIGFRSATSIPLLDPTLRAFKDALPNASLDLKRIDWHEQVERVVDGTVDVAFVSEPLSDPRIAVHPLLSVSRAIVVPSDHPLADRPSVKITELSGYPLAIPGRATEAWASFWTASGRPMDHGVVDGPVVATADESMAVVISGRALVLTLWTIRTHFADGSLRLVPIRDIEPGVIAVAHRVDDESPVVATFIECALSTADAVAPNIDKAKPAG